MINTVIFDMDGVMINSEKEWFEKEISFIKSYIPEWSESLQKKMIGRKASEIYEFLKEKYGLNLDKKFFLSKYDEIAEKIYSEIGLEPNLVELLQFLRENNYKIGLCTSSPDAWVIPVLQKGIKKYFDVVLTASNFSGKGKPSPEVFLEILNRLSSMNSESIVVEDSVNGVASAKFANLKVVGYLNGFNSKDEVIESDFLVTNLLDIKELLIRKK